MVCKVKWNKWRKPSTTSSSPASTTSWLREHQLRPKSEKRAVLSEFLEHLHAHDLAGVQNPHHLREGLRGPWEREAGVHLSQHARLQRHVLRLAGPLMLHRPHPALRQLALGRGHQLQRQVVLHEFIAETRVVVEGTPLAGPARGRRRLGAAGAARAEARRADVPPPSGHDHGRQDAAAAAQLGYRNRVCRPRARRARRRGLEFVLPNWKCEAFGR